MSRARAHLRALAWGFGVLVVCGAVPVADAQTVPEIYLYVNDFTDPPTLLRDEFNALTSLCYDLDVETTAEVAILIVNTTLPSGINPFAVEAFERAGIGKPGEDNGLLLVVSTDERAWRFEVGYGLEGALPAARVGQIGTDVLAPSLAAGDFFNGIYNATVAVGQEIVDKYVPGAPGRPPALIVIDWGKLALAIAVFLLVAAFSKGRMFLWLGNVHKRGGFSGGRSGGAGARGRF